MIFEYDISLYKNTSLPLKIVCFFDKQKYNCCQREASDNVTDFSNAFKFRWHL